MLNNILYHLFGKVLIPAKTFNHICDTREQYKELADHYKSMAYDLMDRIPEDELVNS